MGFLLSGFGLLNLFLAITIFGRVSGAGSMGSQPSLHKPPPVFVRPTFAPLRTVSALCGLRSSLFSGQGRVPKRFCAWSRTEALSDLHHAQGTRPFIGRAFLHRSQQLYTASVHTDKDNKRST